MIFGAIDIREILGILDPPSPLSARGVGDDSARVRDDAARGVGDDAAPLGVWEMTMLAAWKIRRGMRSLPAGTTR